MFSTILSSAGGEMWNHSALVGYGLLVCLIVVLALSSQRWLLGYLFGGMLYWLTVEVINIALLNWLTLSEWNSYVTAIGISWLPLFGWVLYRVLRYDTVSATTYQKYDGEATHYSEHTPIYDDDYQPRFE